MSTHLKRITTRANQIRKAHPSMKWTAAIKKASSELKGGKKSAPKKRVAKKAAPKKRAAVKRSVSVGSVSAVSSSLASLRSQMLTQLKAKYGDLSVKKFTAKGVRDKRKYQKQMSEIAKQIRQYSK